MTTPRARTLTLGAGLVAIAVAVLAFLAWWSDTPEDGLTPGRQRADASESAQARVSREAPREVPAVVEAAAEEPAAETVADVEAVNTGAIVVRVVTGEDEGSPLAGVGVRVAREGETGQYAGRFERTDSKGEAGFADLPPGPYRVWIDRGKLSSCTVNPDETTTIVLKLEPGIEIEGVVVDEAGRGVEGSEVYLGLLVFIGPESAPAAVTDIEGRFRLRGCETQCLVGARAFGHSPAPMRLVQAQAGVTVSVRLELGPAGGAVAGRVVDRQGNPIGGAVCQVSGSPGAAGVAGNSVPAQARTDAAGTFLIVGVPVGEQALAVRSRGFGVWTGSCRVEDDATTNLDITLDAGVTCSGTISLPDGSPASGASVQVGERRTLTWFETRTDADGRYLLEGLTAGSIEIAAALKNRGRAAASLHGDPGQELRWDATLATGVELIGSVVTEAGDPVAGAMLIAGGRHEGKSWHGSAKTAANGRFTISNCPGGTLRVDVSWTDADIGNGHTTVRDVDPLAGELLIRIRPAAPASARVTGRVFGPDGKPCSDAVAWVLGRGVPNSGYRPCDPESGVFEIGPLEPGEYMLRVQSKRYPIVSTELRKLAPEETWDLGVMHLIEGGRVGVELTGATSPRLSIVIRDEDDRYAGRISAGGAQLSEPLAPGRHKLVISGPEIAPETLPFDVSVGETTRLSVVLRSLR